MGRKAVLCGIFAATFGIAGAANGNAAAAVPPATRIIHFDGYSFAIPASWPVYRLGRRSTRCVRYDMSAVYLGVPGENQQCPAHLVGQADTISVSASPPAASPQRAGADGRPVAEHQAAVGLTVSATYGADPGLARAVLSSVRRAVMSQPAPVPQSAGAGSPASPPAPAASARPVQRPGPAASPHGTVPSAPSPAPTGSATPTAGAGRGQVPKPVSTAKLTVHNLAALPGFDTCTAPSLQAMRAWRKSYAAIAIYIGGAEMACGYGNLSASWVRAARAMGWSLIPIYVGIQAPCNSFSQEIDPAHASAQGAGAASEAVLHARSFGIGKGAPIYFDMEAYDNGNKACRNAVLSFLDAWTRQLHSRGYVSGVYSSAASGAEDLGTAASVNGHPLAKPDAMWFALWDDHANLAGTPYLLNPWWTPDRRIKQYQGPHWRKIGGIRLNIDSDWVQGPVY